MAHRHPEHPTAVAKLYICAVKDVWSNRIVGYSIYSRMTSQLAVDALESAVARRTAGGGSAAGCKLHSDRGGQFRSRKLQQSLWRHQMLWCMGQVGSAGDNAAMESFFSLLQRNVLDRRKWTSRKELRIAIVTWIKRIYHRRRRQARLGRLTPIEYEAIMTTLADQAALEPLWWGRSDCHRSVQQPRSVLQVEPRLSGPSNLGLTDPASGPANAGAPGSSSALPWRTSD